MVIAPPMRHERFLCGNAKSMRPAHAQGAHDVGIGGLIMLALDASA
jgi:hypothetical protein